MEQEACQAKLNFQPNEAYNRKMDRKDWPPAEIADALQRGALVVTANRRAARSLRIDCDRQNRAQGLISWHPARILAWDDWTATLWHSLLIEGHTSTLLMNHTQERAAWRQVIEADEVSGLHTADALAGMAADTWNLLCSYNGQQHLRRSTDSVDTRTFQRWAIRFQNQCKANNWLSRAQLEDILRSFVESGKIELAETTIALVGFDSFTPAQSSLLQQISKSGVPLEHLHPTRPAVQHALTIAPDERDELRAAATWARRVLEHKNEARIAVIVPSLDGQRSEIDRTFREILAPELQNIAVSANAGPFEFSVGTMLARTPIAITAIHLLRWMATPLPIEQVSALLLSPYFAAGNSELQAAAEFDAFELRQAKILRPEISIEWLIAAIAHSPQRIQLSGLSARLRAMRAAAAQLFAGNEPRLYSDWAERMRKLLEVASWGRATGEDSVEFQARLKWHSALDELATLDFNGTRITYVEALDTLEQIANEIMFAPESREAPVQIMAPLEAAGSSFDAIWFLRCGDLSWPAPQSPNPLLTWRLQCELKMPGVDMEFDAEQAGRTAQRITESAETVIFSYAAESEQGKQRRSPALNGLSLDETRIAEFMPGEPDCPAIELEEIADSVPLPSLPDKVIRGGAEILRLQAACGFRAFAERRLWASEISSVTTGMDPAQRGTIVHWVLEAFWKEVHTQQALQDMPPYAREALLDQCISNAISKAAGHARAAWDTAYLDMQRERLRNLLRPWLELELSRAPFTVVDREMELKDARIGPLRIDVRVDRIDAGEHGEIIIDYKTGNADPKDWLSERPDQPQLPLYAILSNNQLEALAFAEVRAGKDMGLEGFTAEKVEGITTPRKAPPNLSGQVVEWRTVLTSLAESFANGDARVNPKMYPATCTYCSQRLLCRLDPAALEAEIDDFEMEIEHG
ncbi:MAG TPA: PD-(D/E)XK nuclease family protein [Edaphobacter sp.]|nr:PD-(D/E)XK nuclease family protein [Edaphobacter sp.]